MSTQLQTVVESPAEIERAPQVSAPRTDIVTLFERLASNPDVPIEKLERLIEMQERIVANQARTSFNAAFALMQEEMPVILERGDAAGRYKYAQLEDIVEAVRPVLARHGFALTHTTEWPDAKTVRVIGILAHRDGHERRTEFMSIGDTSGSKNAIQSLGSALSYGRRYTTNSLLNIVTRGEDDDGKSAPDPRRASTPAKQAAPPDGYDDWLADMTATASEGMAALQAAWKASRKDYRAHLTATAPGQWAQIKQRAEQVGKTPAAQTAEVVNKLREREERRRHDAREFLSDMQGDTDDQDYYDAFISDGGSR